MISIHASPAKYRMVRLYKTFPTLSVLLWGLYYGVSQKLAIYFIIFEHKNQKHL